jgi:alpha-mannosidase
MCLNHFLITLELSSNEKIARIGIEYDNQVKDHRIRIRFPTQIKSEEISADGHFYVVPRDFKRPYDENWRQKWVPTHHQNKFVSIKDGSSSFTIANVGLPEYEAIKHEDGIVEFAITLLRSVEWLSRSDIKLRPGDAGPPLNTPGAQCIGEHKFQLALTTGKENWLNSHTYRTIECFTYPLQPAVPKSLKSSLRIMDSIPLFDLSDWEMLDYEKRSLLPTSLSFFTVNNPKISVTAIKRAESGDALIIRLLNLSNERQEDELAFYKDIKKVIVVNLNEEIPSKEIKAKIEFSSKSLKLSLDPFVLATFKIFF